MVFLVSCVFMVPSLQSRYGAPRAAVLALQADDQQAVFQPRRRHVHAVGQHEGAGELAGRDAAVEIGPVLIVALPALDDELVLLDGDLQLIPAEAGNCKRDAKPLGLALSPAAGVRCYRAGSPSPEVLDARSSIRSSSSNPSRNGEENMETRDMTVGPS